MTTGHVMQLITHDGASDLTPDPLPHELKYHLKLTCDLLIINHTSLKIKMFKQSHNENNWNETIYV